MPPAPPIVSGIVDRRRPRTDWLDAFGVAAVTSAAADTLRETPKAAWTRGEDRTRIVDS